MEYIRAHEGRQISNDWNDFSPAGFLFSPFEDADAQAAGSIRAEMEKVGKPVGAYDLLIAGQAVRPS